MNLKKKTNINSKIIAKKNLNIENNKNLIKIIKDEFLKNFIIEISFRKNKNK